MIYDLTLFVFLIITFKFFFILKSCLKLRSQWRINLHFRFILHSLIEQSDD
jgi:hypothetical protein